MKKIKRGIKKFDIFDKVWVMVENKPRERFIDSITEKISDLPKNSTFFVSENSTYFVYSTIPSHHSGKKGDRDGDRIFHMESDIFLSKEELINSL